MCTADPTGLPYSFGTDSLQPHLMTYTGTPGNHNCILHVCLVKTSERILNHHIVQYRPNWPTVFNRYRQFAVTSNKIYSHIQYLHRISKRISLLFAHVFSRPNWHIVLIQYWQFTATLNSSRRTYCRLNVQIRCIYNLTSNNNLQKHLRAHTW